MSEEQKPSKLSLIDKADVINFTVLVYVALTVIMAFAQLIIAYRSSDPLNVLLDLRGWVIPLVSGIFLAYGITKGQGNAQ